MASSSTIRSPWLQAAAVLASLLLASTAQATPSSDFSYFGAGSMNLDFDEVAMAHGTLVDTQYASFGVTFSPNVWFEDIRGGVGWDGDTIANFVTGTSTSNPTVEFVFGGPVDGAALEFAANGGNDFLFEALLGGSVVEQFSHSQGGCCAAQVLGFEDVQFDTLRVSHQSGGSTFFIADQLTWMPVPEPGSALLVGLGLTLLAWRPGYPSSPSGSPSANARR